MWQPDDDASEIDEEEMSCFLADESLVKEASDDMVGEGRGTFMRRTLGRNVGKVGEFFRKLNNSVGRQFLLVTFIIYGIGEGSVESLNELGRVYFWKARDLTPGETQRNIAISDLSWNLKPAFALMMESVPILGWSYKPYLIGFSLLGSVGFAVIAAAPRAVSNAAYNFFFFAGLNAVVWMDTAIDGVTISKMKEFPQIAKELPSYQQLCLMGTSIVMASLSGVLLSAIHLVGVFSLNALFLVMCTIAIFYFDDKRKKNVSVSPQAIFSRVREIASAFRQTKLLKISLYIAIASFGFDLNGAMVYWYDDVAHYSKGFQGVVVSVGWLVGILAVIIYALFLQKKGQRCLLISFQIVQMLLSLLDLLLVTVAKDAFWGHFIALSDRVGTRAVGKLKFIVITVAVAGFTPSGGEATIYAVIAALSNFTGSNFLSTYVGSWLLDGLGIRQGNYSHLPIAIIIRSFARLAPIPFVSLLIPASSFVTIDPGELKRASSLPAPEASAEEGIELPPSSSAYS